MSYPVRKPGESLTAFQARLRAYRDGQNSVQQSNSGVDILDVVVAAEVISALDSSSSFDSSSSSSSDSFSGGGGDFGGGGSDSSW